MPITAQKIKLVVEEYKPSIECLPENKLLNKKINYPIKEEYSIFPDFIPCIGALAHGAREYRRDGMGCSGHEFILDLLRFKDPKRSLFLAYHLIVTSIVIFLPVIYDIYIILRDYT